MNRARVHLVFGVSSVLFATTAATSGCVVARNIGVDETDGSADEGGDTLGDSDMGLDVGDGDGDGDGPALPVEAVDILFVIDNSGSMGDEQSFLVHSVQRMVDDLDARGLDYRIAFTTTDVGNIECSGTGPESGQFRLSSCRERQGEFEWPKVNPTVQVFDLACGNDCSTEVSDALSIKATTTEASGEAKPRPWIEKGKGSSNVEGGTLREALGCYLPQGVDGCGFESPLEAARLAIERSSEPGTAQFGFMRDDAALVVVLASDEADCSADPSLQGLVFDRNMTESQKVFWEDPTSNIPTSAICWNAGVVCEGDPSGYDGCEPADFGVDGQAVTEAGDAVLEPVSAYTALFDDLAAAKKARNANLDVLVGVIAGVPQGYENGAAQLVYKESTDATTSDNFGIDWGCTGVAKGSGDVQVAVPPVRLRAFAEARPSTGPRKNLSSICAPDYDRPLLDLIAAVDALDD